MNRSPNNRKLIVGLGKTGLSCVRYLHAQGAAIAVTDSRENPPGLAELKADFAGVPVALGGFDEAMCQAAEEIILSPGVSLHEPAIAKQVVRGKKIIGDIELFAQQAKAPVVAITGSNGKSTVTTLVGEMAQAAGFKVAVGGNLGTPALDLLTKTEPDLYVLELSSFQLETTFSLHPKTATVLNISPDHMDRYKNLAEYASAKHRIYQHCAMAIINREDPLAIAPGLLSKPTLSFGLDVPEHDNFGLRKQDGVVYLAQGETLLLTTTALKIKGRHQLANALAALALGTAAEIPMPAMLSTLQQFHGLAHRCQWVRKMDDVDWYNDSKATNVGAALAAIDGLGAEIHGKLVIIAGGQGKKADFKVLRDAIQTYARSLILIGEDAPQMAEALTGTTAILRATSLENAVDMAREQAQPNDCVLLVPACASFDMFKNFEHRGEVFMALVRALS